MASDHRRLLVAALGFARLAPATPALATLKIWLGSWTGIGAIAVGMQRQGYHLQLTRYADQGGRANFYPTGMAPLDVRAEPGLPLLQGQHDPLQQVILNLLTNAIDATPPGGRIQVTLAPAAPGEVEIAISDTGRGISAADRKRIFEPFFSTKEAGRGTGLGLFITAEIVREHKGRIEIESEEDRGSIFRITLPAAASVA